MKYGVREICDVVLRAKATQKVGNKIFYKNEPVIYFDTLKTSSLEGAATTVYAQGGRGNSRLMAWEGERTVTFTMEDALISTEGFMILSGAGLIEAGEVDVNGKTFTVKQHATQIVDAKKYEDGVITLDAKPYFGEGDESYVYIFPMKDGEILTEPYLGFKPENDETGYKVEIRAEGEYTPNGMERDFTDKAFDAVLVDFYIERETGAKQIEITPDKFGGNYYLEASTLFRDQRGVDMPAEFIIPNCKIQSNFTFTMASSGDPSTFTFTMDAFPDYTRFDRSKKVLAVIQVIDDEAALEAGDARESTWVADAKADEGENV